MSKVIKGSLTKLLTKHLPNLHKSKPYNDRIINLIESLLSLTGSLFSKKSNFLIFKNYKISDRKELIEKVDIRGLKEIFIESHNIISRKEEIKKENFITSAGFLRESLAYFQPESDPEMEIANSIEEFIFSIFQLEKEKSGIDYLHSDDNGLKENPKEVRKRRREVGEKNLIRINIKREKMKAKSRDKIRENPSKRLLVKRIDMYTVEEESNEGGEYESLDSRSVRLLDSLRNSRNVVENANNGVGEIIIPKFEHSEKKRQSVIEDIKEVIVEEKESIADEDESEEKKQIEEVIENSENSIQSNKLMKKYEELVKGMQSQNLREDYDPSRRRRSKSTTIASDLTWDLTTLNSNNGKILKTHDMRIIRTNGNEFINSILSSDRSHYYIPGHGYSRSFNDEESQNKIFKNHQNLIIMDNIEFKKRLDAIESKLTELTEKNSKVENEKSTGKTEIKQVIIEEEFEEEKPLEQNNEVEDDEESKYSTSSEESSNSSESQEKELLISKETREVSFIGMNSISDFNTKSPSGLEIRELDLPTPENTQNLNCKMTRKSVDVVINEEEEDFKSFRDKTRGNKEKEIERIEIDEQEEIIHIEIAGIENEEKTTGKELIKENPIKIEPKINIIPPVSEALQSTTKNILFKKEIRKTSPNPSLPHKHRNSLLGPQKMREKIQMSFGGLKKSPTPKKDYTLLKIQQHRSNSKISTVELNDISLLKDRIEKLKKSRPNSPLNKIIQRIKSSKTPNKVVIPVISRPRISINKNVLDTSTSIIQKCKSQVSSPRPSMTRAEESKNDHISFERMKDNLKKFRKSIKEMKFKNRNSLIETKNKLKKIEVKPGILDGRRGSWGNGSINKSPKHDFFNRKRNQLFVSKKEKKEKSKSKVDDDYKELLQNLKEAREKSKEIAKEERSIKKIKVKKKKPHSKEKLKFFNNNSFSTAARKSSRISYLDSKKEEIKTERSKKSSNRVKKTKKINIKRNFSPRGKVQKLKKELEGIIKERENINKDKFFQKKLSIPKTDSNSRNFIDSGELGVTVGSQNSNKGRKSIGNRTVISTKDFKKRGEFYNRTLKRLQKKLYPNQIEDK